MRIATTPVHSPYCDSKLIDKHVHARSGEAYYRCRDYLRFFQRGDRYEGNKPVVLKRIVERVLYGVGVEDTCHVLGVNTPTVVIHLRKLQIHRHQPLAYSSPSGSV